MIRVVAKNCIKMGKRDAFLEVVKELIVETRKEKGCIFYDLCENIDDENTLTFIEEWETMDHLLLHTKTPHYTNIVPSLTEFVDSDDVVVYKKTL